MNKVILLGNLTRDPEVSTTPSGISVCKFGLAVNRPFKNQQGEYDVDFFNIVVWRERADTCGKYLQKGSKVAVSGRIEIRAYEDKEGNKRQATDIVADDVQFISTGQKNADAAPASPTASKKQKASELTPIEDDELPF